VGGDSILERQFERLRRPTESDVRLSGSRIAWRARDFVAKNADDQPIVLIAANDIGGYPSIQLRHLRVDFGLRCKVSEDNEREFEGNFVSITGLDLATDLSKLFMRVAEGLLRALSTDPSSDEIRHAVLELSDLFRALETPGRGTLQGLWTELLVIVDSDAPEDWVKGWREAENETFDFAFFATRMDVKSSQSQRRVHEFSLGQLQAPSGSVAYIASALVRRSAGGVGVLGLADRIAAMIADNSSLVSKIWRNVIGTLGQDFCESADVLFDEAYSRQSLRFIPAERVPRPRHIDLGVTNVRFLADIDEVAGEWGIRRLSTASVTTSVR
jgi:hypothetical protein